MPFHAFSPFDKRPFQRPKITCGIARR
jgi:hypothetical protein